MWKMFGKEKNAGICGGWITLEEKMLPLWKTFSLLQSCIKILPFPQKKTKSTAFGKMQTSQRRVTFALYEEKRCLFPQVSKAFPKGKIETLEENIPMGQDFPDFPKFPQALLFLLFLFILLFIYILRKQFHFHRKGL